MRTLQYVTVVYFLARCCVFAGEDEAPEPVRRSARAERVVLQLSWRHKFQFAGYYMAQEKGYYREAGFDVELREWRGGIGSVKSVVLGRADFGISQGQLNGEPVVVVASVLQRSPAVIVALERSGIQTLEDLAGKRVMNDVETLAYDYWAMLAARGLSPEDLKLIPHSGTIDDLVEGRADACMGYVTDEPYALRKRGIPFVAFHPGDYGVDAFAEMLFTARRMALAAPGRVKAFRDASLRGWRYAMDHVDEAVDLILRSYAPGADRAELEFEAAALAALMELDVVDIGYVNPERWRRMIQAQGAMPGDPVGPMTDAEIEAMLFDEASADPSRRWIRTVAATLAVALVLLAVSGGAALSLRHVVRRKTQALTEANAQLHLEKAHLEEVGTLLRLERDFAASSLLATTLGECQERIVELVVRIPCVDCSGLYFRNGKTGVFEMLAHRGLSAAFALRWGSYRDDLPGFGSLCVGRNVSYTVRDVSPEVGEGMLGEGLRCVHIFPVAFESAVVAALHVGSRQAEAIPDEVQTALESLAVRLGGVLAHFQAQGRLRESEALFRRVAEGAFDVIALIDEEGRFRYVNDRVSQVFGYSGAELEGERFTVVLSEEARPQRMEAFRSRLEGKRVPERYEVTLCRKDRRLFPAEISIKEIQWRGRRAFVCVIQDLSERKRLEAQILEIDDWEKARIGQDLHDSVGQELVGIACIMKALEHSLEEAHSPHARKAARAHEICMAAHEGLRGIVRGLLPLGSGELLPDGLKRLCANMRSRSAISCEVHNAFASLKLDPLRAKHLYFIALEAVANAVRHGGARNIVIALAQEGDDGVLSIDDDGNGFDAETASRSGSGLAIMRYRANVLGGSVAVQPRVGGGTTVRCKFPLLAT